jgi:asparagine synthase (glutamine-hydrolysing)
MCGIAGIIRKSEAGFNIHEKIIALSQAMAHRGPDGEGFMTLHTDHGTPHFGTVSQTHSRKDLLYTPQAPLPAESNATLAFAHRRLAIIDLSESGHQPMCDASGKIWITFNGEIYNYLELKAELIKAGHSFVSESDTEVVIHAYQQWGTECVSRFNGMWAFCIYDERKHMCFASRDRLGVKPFYYLNKEKFIAFASEQKAFVKAGLLKPAMNQKALHNYLTNGLLENEEQNFFEGLTELWPGTNLTYDLHKKTVSTHSYYNLKQQNNLENDHLSEAALIEKIKHTFENAVKIRLRSDVEVGTCLSGGIDSSALAVTMSEFSQHPVNCFTSVFRNQAINEEHFADTVASKIQAKCFKTEPNLEGFEKELNDLIYSQDVPIWSTSTYAQYKVMALAKEHHIKVVLDGQGADELFGGYHHHFTAKWNNLIAQGLHVSALKDILKSNKTIHASWLFYLKENVKQKYHHHKTAFSEFLNADFLRQQEIINPSIAFNNLNEQLIDDIYNTRLKAFLKCEDRCGMWHSVESRTPFSDDVELINLLFSFNGNKKIKDGVSKYLLREAVKDKLPSEIYKRYDKKGFETPMQDWMRKIKPQMISDIKAADFDFIKTKNLEKFDINNDFQYKLLFKLFVLSRWQKVFQS